MSFHKSLQVVGRSLILYALVPSNVLWKKEF